MQFLGVLTGKNYRAERVNRLVVLWIVFFIQSYLSDVQAQAFTGRGGLISDEQPAFKIDSFAIDVKGLGVEINEKFGLAKICLNIVHPKISDLKIELLSPDGTSIWLSNRNGGDEGSGYYSTCFRSNGHSGYLHQANAPYTGEFIPDGRMLFLNNGQNPNGIWYLLIQDLRSGNRGSLGYVSLIFEDNPMPGGEEPPCRIENGISCKCPDGSDDCELLPDLVILPVFTENQVMEYAHNDASYPGQLRFAVSIANIGDGPIETYGNNQWFCGDTPVKDSSIICDDGTHARQNVFQRIYRKKGSEIVYNDRLAGTNYFEDLPGHNHYHNDNWVEFRLVKKEATGVKTLISTGRKISFCLFDSGICSDDDLVCRIDGMTYGGKSLDNYGLGRYADCNTPGGRTGISVGAYDTYGVHFEGQHIDLPKGLPTGEYLLEIELDPVGKYIEKNKANNIFSTPVHISKQL